MSMDQLQISHSLKYNGKGPLRSIFRSCGLRLAMHRYPGEVLLPPCNLLPGPTRRPHRTGRATRILAVPSAVPRVKKA